MSVSLDQWRISNGWYDIAGRWNDVSDDVRDRLRASIDAKLQAEDQSPPPPVWFVRPGESHRLATPCELLSEDSASSGVDRRSIEELPSDLPLGAHHLVPIDGGPTTRLFVVPASQPLIERCWGWTVQLYAARSLSSWGQGDLGDLARLCSWAGNHGAALMSHNPLGDTLPIGSQQPSPYFTSSRKFSSLLYLDLGAVPGSSQVSERLGRLVSRGAELNSSELIERDEIFRLKLEALREIWSNCLRDAQLRAQLDSAWNDSELVDHATFNALAERFGTGWSSWDRTYSHPRSRAVEEFRVANSSEVEFWLWVQSLLSEQYAVAARSGAGLMNDVPVGFGVDGSDAWVDQDCLALDWRIGAPGDEFNPQGQNWGIVPYIPQKLRAAAYEPWRRTIRRLVRDVDALRIDHVMGLFRLFVIPEETDSNDGAYLYQYGTELLDIALMEAVRAGVTIAGEDLGTVEDGVREALVDRNVLGYKVGWFEDEPPSQWNEVSIGSISTHDLPTIAGLVGGHDAKQRLAAGLDVEPADDERMLHRLRSNFLDEDSDGSVKDVVTEAYDTLARAGSRAVFVSLEDACAVEERPNLPGTVDENPNWRRPLPVPIEDLDSTLAPAIAAAMATRAIERSTRRNAAD